ncbi:MAG: hypothetical protein RR910_08760 [Acidaminococcaceae bacterium]
MSFMIAAAKEVRGQILAILKRNYPYQTGDKLIYDILQDMQYTIGPAIISGYITYLEEKGYVETEEVKAYGEERRLCKLTPKGVDLTERNIPADPGVMLRD